MARRTEPKGGAEMRRSLAVWRGLRSALALLPTLVAVVATAEMETVAGQGRSPIVLNRDGGGTTVVKDLGDSSFQVQQLWSNNTVNGIQSFSDGDFAFVNCAPTLRTLEDIELSCSIFDQTLGTWGEPPVTTTVPLDFLDGPFANPYNSLFQWTGEYLTVFELGGESYSFRMRFLEAFETQDGFPILIGATNPESRAFMLRNVDVPGGTTDQTNVSVGMQYDGACFDLDLNPGEPGGVLTGWVGGRELNADGSCGNLIEENRPVALVPSGEEPEAGASCRYSVRNIGDCIPVDPFPKEDVPVCLPCTGSCPFFPNGVTLIVENQIFSEPAYVRCEDMEIELVDEVCSRGCDDGIPATSVGASTPPAALLTFTAR
jgi:hypothetical protein